MLEIDRRGLLGMAAALPFASPLGALAAEPVAGEADGTAGGAAGWDLTDLFPDLAAWDRARRDTLALIPRLAAWQGRLGESAEVMAQALAELSDADRAAARIYIHASLRADEDVRIAENQERLAQARDMASALNEAAAWLAPEVLALGRDKVESFIAANETIRRRFAFGLRDTLREAKHTLDTQGETLLAGAATPMGGTGEVRGALIAADIPWPTITLSDGRQQRLDDQGYSLTRDAPVREDRKRVFDTFWGAYGQYRNTLGAAYASKLKGDVFRMKARGYPSSLAMALSGNAVPEGVYRTLVAETNAGLPQLHRYFELRRRMLGLPDMQYHDIYPPLVSLDRTFTLEEMRGLMLTAAAPLGKDYVAELTRASAARWMDPWPRPGKRSGAYMSGGAYDVHPYLLLNLGKNYDGLSTYVHEWGHAMHSQLSRKAQPYETAGYATFIAEIASTCNEQLLNDTMLKRARTREEKLFYLGQRLEGFRGTFFRQTMFAEFELKAHELAEAGEGLSGRRFNDIYLDLLKRYHGPKVGVDPAYAIEWAYVSHFYRYFYVYQYATSITAATWFARSILRGGKAEREAYLSVLRAGGSDYPTQILKRAGLDMTRPEPYRALVQDFADTLDAIEGLLA